MKLIPDLKSFRRLRTGASFHEVYGRPLLAFPSFYNIYNPVSRTQKINGIYRACLIFALFLTILFACIPNDAFSKGGIVAVPIMDSKGKPVVLYKGSYALVIGISDYTGGWPKLPGVKTDVKAVTETLEKIGFKVILVENPNRMELEAAYKNFVLEYGLDPDNRLLFYYAGHGHTHKPSYATNDPEEWMGYLVARNAPKAQDNLANFFKHSISMRTIENTALSIESKHAIFIFDSCFSGTIFGLSRSIPEDIKERAARPVRQFITSGTADQVVPDISIFRRQFISALEGEADRNDDGYVTGSELGLFLEETVTNLSRRNQTPRYGKVLNRFLNKGDFIFNLSQEEAPQVAALKYDDVIESIKRLTDEVVANRGERSNRIQIHYSKLKELDQFYEGSISNKTKIKLWKDFITLFPHSNPYLDEAKEIIRNLREGEIVLSPQGESIDPKIENRFAALESFEQQAISREKKIEAWLGFVNNFPENNPKLDAALAKISVLKKEQERLAEEQRLAEETARIEEQERMAEQKRLAEEEAQRKEQERLVEKQRLAEETARIEEQERMAEQKRLAEEEAQRKEQERLVEEQRLAEETARIEEQERMAEQKRVAEEEAQRKEQERLAEEQRLESEKSQGMEVARLEPGTFKPSPEKAPENEEMILIPAGKYAYGDSNPPEVKHLPDFYMDIQEVTQQDYERVIGKNPSRFKGENLPVEKVTWLEAKEYCEREGKRLPTSEEWEKAARAGSHSKFYWGEILGKNNANCNDCGSQWDGSKTAPVRSFPPNAWGLYDMAGNVWEWVDASYDKKFKVLRGGSWMDEPTFVQSDASYFVMPGNRSSDIGFRCASSQAVGVKFGMDRMTEEKAQRKEQGRLAEEKRLESEQSEGMEVARLEPGTSKPSPEKATGNEGMVLIPAGKYVFGNSQPPEIKHLRGFHMDTQEVTQKDYERVMGKNPSRFKGENLPVEKVTWQEAKEYCERVGKRLPTSEEWEKAARAATFTKYYWGPDIVKNKANCTDCGSQWDGMKTAPVRSFPPNAWGLYDMAGNVWEWVDKTHGNQFKVLRGGSWMDDPTFLSPSEFYFVMPDNRSSDIGFRCARGIGDSK